MSQNQINVKTLKTRLKPADYEKIFKALNIPIYSKGTKYWTLYTACHNKDPYKGSHKLLFFLDSGMFQCLTKCSASFDCIALVQKRLALLSQPNSFIDAINFIVETTGLEADTIKRINKPTICDWSNLERFARFKSTGSTLTPYNKRILNQLDKRIPQQWIDEGISPETMAKYRIGYYERTGATTIPCFDKQGQLVGIRVRNWNEQELAAGRKYTPLMLLDETIYKFPTNQVFYGINYNAPEIERTNTVFLVEGEKTVLKFDTLYNEKNIALAMYGKNLGSARRNQLIQLGVNKVVYIPDNDWIGKSQADFDNWEQEIIRFGKQFNGYAQVEVVWDNLGLLNPKDNAMDGDKETWEKLYKNREILI